MEEAIRYYLIDTYRPGIKYLKDSDLDTVRSIGGKELTLRFIAEKASRYVSWSNATPPVEIVGTVPYGDDTAASLTGLMYDGKVAFVKALVDAMETMKTNIGDKITYTWPTITDEDKNVSTSNFVTIRVKYFNAFSSLTNVMTQATTAKTTSLGNVVRILKSRNMTALPTVAISSVKSIAGKRIEVKGTILNAGSSDVSERGFVWSSTQQIPTLENGTKMVVTGTDTDFNATIPSATATATVADPVGTVYHIRAYAKHTAQETTRYSSTIRGVLLDVPAAPTLVGTASFKAPAGPTVFEDPDDSTTTILYQFDTFNFNKLGTTGPTGPSSLSGYGSSYPGVGTTSALKINSASQGIQLWTVPRTGTYEFDMAGAEGGGKSGALGGRAVQFTFRIYLTVSTVIKILVGQKGSFLQGTAGVAGGGGGGSYVVSDNGTSALDKSFIIAIAGGGGGAGAGVNISAMHATSSNTGQVAYTNTSLTPTPIAATNGDAGGSRSGSTAGAGFLGNASSSKSFKDGGSGGNTTNTLYANGGFGGGGLAVSATTQYGASATGGGGGGYSGGSAFFGAHSLQPGSGPGGGGGSFTSPDAKIISTYEGATEGTTGDGFVKVTYIPPPPAIHPLMSITASIPINHAIISSGFIWGQQKIVTSSDKLIETLKNRTIQYVSPNASSISLENISVRVESDYRIRAFVKSKLGITYSDERIFTTRDITTPTLAATSVVSDITSTTAKSGGNITSQGLQPITGRGIVWATTPNPTITNNKTNDGTDLGIFTSSLTSLAIGTTYYVRAYATNSLGTAYGEEVSFTTLRPTAPIIQPMTISNITHTSAVVSTTISDGGASLTEIYALILSNVFNTTVIDGLTPTSPYYTDGINFVFKVYSTSISNNVSITIPNLYMSTHYSVAIYATNSVGKSYTSSGFKTLASSGYDIDLTNFSSIKSNSNYTLLTSNTASGNIVSGTVLNLTNAVANIVSNLFYKSRIFSYNFSLQWTMYIGSSNSSSGGEGFCIQWTSSNTTTGRSGTDLGSYNNAFQSILFNSNGTSGSTIKHFTNGALISTKLFSNLRAATRYYWADYTPSRKVISIYISTDTNKPFTPSCTFPNFELPTSNCFFGFGAATGSSLTDIHRLERLYLNLWV